MNKKIKIYVYLIFLLTSCVNPKNNKHELSTNNDSLQFIQDSNYYYHPSNSIIYGKLIKKQVFGAPNFGETPETDKKVTIYLVVLNKKINVLYDSKADSTDIDELNIDTIQLASSKWELFPLNLNSYVKLKGGFFHSFNAHHYTNVLMFVDEMDRIQ